VKTWLTLLLIIVLGTAAIYRTTEGFRIVTTEDARRLVIAAQEPRLPEAGVVFPGAPPQPLSSALRADGRVAIVSFFYARCASVCMVQGTVLQQMQERIRSDGLGDRVRLMSITFDGGDDDDSLRAYAKQMRADVSEWQFARITDAAQRKALLDTVGIVVLPAPLGQFQHNAAFHIVDQDGRLLRVIDYDDPDGALAFALAAGSKTVAGAGQGGALR
jgi:protein SCO1/2